MVLHAPFATIDNCPPLLGICGAGIVELLFVLIRQDIIDHRGHLQAGYPGVRPGRYGLEYVVACASQNGNGEDICITQKDITEIQLAKAAIHARHPNTAGNKDTRPQMKFKRWYLPGHSAATLT